MTSSHKTSRIGCFTVVSFSNSNYASIVSFSFDFIFFLRFQKFPDAASVNHEMKTKLLCTIDLYRHRQLHVPSKALRNEIEFNEKAQYGDNVALKQHLFTRSFASNYREWDSTEKLFGVNKIPSRFDASSCRCVYAFTPHILVISNRSARHTAIQSLFSFPQLSWIACCLRFQSSSGFKGVS